jgi:hypothetical protein
MNTLRINTIKTCIIVHTQGTSVIIQVWEKNYNSYCMNMLRLQSTSSVRLDAPLSLTNRTPSRWNWYTACKISVFYVTNLEAQKGIDKTSRNADAPSTKRRETKFSPTLRFQQLAETLD